MVATAQHVTLAPGTRLGKYEIVRHLAFGGMAELYLARATGLAGFEKLVVLKRILPRLVGEPEFERMFLDEARLTATLSHPNVVQVYDVDKVGESTFFTMEYVHGHDLSTVLETAARKKRGLSLALALHIVSEVAAGLHYAHDKRGRDGAPLGTVHRDVSPRNVMITHDGAVKIVDFGIAKAAVRETKTQTGTVKGTLLYMSPEQAQGHDLDRRSDVFALGVLLFELTTGTRLFKGKNDFQILYQLVQEDAPLPSTRREGYPPALEELVIKALCRDRNQRYATSEELRSALEGFVRAEGLVATAASLGAYMRELYGDPGDTAELAVMKAPDGAPSPDAGAPLGEDLGVPGSVPRSATYPSGSHAQRTESVALPIRKTSPVVWVALGALALGAAGALAWRAWGGASPEGAAPTATLEPSPSPSPNVPAAVATATEPSTAPSSARTEPALPSAAPSARPGPSADRPRGGPRPAAPAGKPETAASAAPPVKPPGTDKPKWDLDSPLPP